jgi:uncharacterized membrane protein
MDKKTVKGLLGGALGLVAAILILTIGFWKALLIVGLTAIAGGCPAHGSFRRLLRLSRASNSPGISR